MTVSSETEVGQPTGVKPASALTEDRWTNLLRRIKTDRCTPFIGAGACDPLLVPPPWKIADDWASDAECRYPLEDTTNLPRVAQYRATNGKTPQEDLYWDWISVKLAESKDANDVHRCLAAIPFSVYICTHYHDFKDGVLKEKRRDPLHGCEPWPLGATN